MIRFLYLPDDLEELVSLDTWFANNDFVQFETVEWSLTPDGGETISLLENSSDPLQLEKA